MNRRIGDRLRVSRSVLVVSTAGLLCSLVSFAVLPLMMVIS